MIRTFNEQETFELGERIGAQLQPGDTVSLTGELGAGKTHLTKGIAAGMGVSNPQHVNSPTFVLVQEYAGRSTLYHFDCYRLGDESEFAELGYEEFLKDGVCVIEWADRVAGHLSSPHLDIQIDYGDDPTERKFEWTWSGLPKNRTPNI